MERFRRFAHWRLRWVALFFASWLAAAVLLRGTAQTVAFIAIVAVTVAVIVVGDIRMFRTPEPEQPLGDWKNVYPYGE